MANSHREESYAYVDTLTLFPQHYRPIDPFETNLSQVVKELLGHSRNDRKPDGPSVVSSASRGASQDGLRMAAAKAPRHPQELSAVEEGSHCMSEPQEHEGDESGHSRGSSKRMPTSTHASGRKTSVETIGSSKDSASHRARPIASDTGGSRNSPATSLKAQQEEESSGAASRFGSQAVEARSGVEGPVVPQPPPDIAFEYEKDEATEQILRSPQDMESGLAPATRRRFSTLVTALAVLLAALYDTIVRQVYLHLLLRLPTLYFSRVTKVFKDVDMGMDEIQRLTLEALGNRERNASVLIRAGFTHIAPPDNATQAVELGILRSSWHGLLDSLITEWSTFNIISALLLSAVLTILQIEDASTDLLIRYTALLSLICALTSLTYGCIYIVRFNTMRKMHKAAEWANESSKSPNWIFWSVGVMLAMPAVWLGWSMISFIVCVMAFLWQTGPEAGPPTEADPPEYTHSEVLAPRIFISLVLALGVVYLILIGRTFLRYGDSLDEAWRLRVLEWLAVREFQEKEARDSTKRRRSRSGTLGSRPASRRTSFPGAPPHVAFTEPGEFRPQNVSATASVVEETTASSLPPLEVPREVVGRYRVDGDPVVVQTPGQLPETSDQSDVSPPPFRTRIIGRPSYDPFSRDGDSQGMSPPRLVSNPIQAVSLEFAASTPHREKLLEILRLEPGGRVFLPLTKEELTDPVALRRDVLRSIEIKRMPVEQWGPFSSAISDEWKRLCRDTERGPYHAPLRVVDEWNSKFLQSNVSVVLVEREEGGRAWSLLPESGTQVEVMTQRR